MCQEYQKEKKGEKEQQCNDKNGKKYKKEDKKEEEKKEKFQTGLLMLSTRKRFSIQQNGREKSYSPCRELSNDTHIVISHIYL